MEIGVTGTVANSLATMSYYAGQSGCTARLCRYMKLKFMKNVKAVILPDIFKTQLFENGIYSLDEKLKLLDLEKMHSISFNKEVLSSIKKIKTSDVDVYIALAVKSLRELMVRYQLNNKLRCQLVVFLSSHKLARQLGIKRKNIYTYAPSSELMESELAKKDSRLKNYVSDTNKKNQKKNSNTRIFTSKEDLNNQIQALLGDKVSIRSHAPAAGALRKEYTEPEEKLTEIRLDIDDQATIKTFQ